MKISASVHQDVRHVARHMSRVCLDERLALSFSDTDDEVRADVIQRYSERPECMTAFAGEEPVAVFGLFTVRPNVVTTLFFSTDKFSSIALGFTRLVRREIFPPLWQAGVQRIESLSMEIGTKHWIEVVGLKKEAVFPRYGKNGEAFAQFALLKEAE